MTPTVTHLVIGKDCDFIRTGSLGDFDWSGGTAALIQPFVATTRTDILTAGNFWLGIHPAIGQTPLA